MGDTVEDEGYFIYADMDREGTLGCYVGYVLGNPDGFPRLQVGLYADPEAARSDRARAIIEWISRLDGWGSTRENTEVH